MRIESSVTSISWIPSEAVRGMTRLPFDMGVAHYDEPPPEVVHADDLEDLRVADRFRFANQLRAWIDVEDGRIVDCGYSGGGHIGATTIQLGRRRMTFAAVSLPDRQQPPHIEGTSVRFVQTAGGRTGAPAPRRVKYPPFVQLAAPLAWTTLSLTLNVDGTATHQCTGASPFPRHWIYDGAGTLVQKTGLIDFKGWYTRAFGKHTPWGDQDSETLVTEVESALERELSREIMDGEVAIRKLGKGDTLVIEGDEGAEMFLLLDGVLDVEVGGKPVTSVGPGAVLGERSGIEGGRRTATLRALTLCKVAVVAADRLQPDALSTLATQHRREDKPGRVGAT